MLHRIPKKISGLYREFQYWYKYESIYLPQQMYSYLLMPIILLLSLYFFVKTSDDPFFDWIAEYQIIIELFGQCELYNETINQISLGILVSCIFYILVAAVPEYLKKSIQKGHLSDGMTC